MKLNILDKFSNLHAAETAYTRLNALCFIEKATLLFKKEFSVRPDPDKYRVEVEIEFNSQVTGFQPERIGTQILQCFSLATLPEDLDWQHFAAYHVRKVSGDDEDGEFYEGNKWIHKDEYETRGVPKIVGDNIKQHDRVSIYIHNTR